MDRVSTSVKALLTLVVAVHLHHRFHGPTIDYLGLAVAAGASWAGVPGPGEPVLIAEAVFAGRHDLDIVSVILAAWVGAVIGGIVGWLAGLQAGRAVILAPGPFRGARLHAIARGEELFARHPVLAIYLTPSWVAGINRPRPSTYLIVNVLSCALWAAGIGLAAYYLGPAAVDVVDDLGLVTAVALGVLVLGTVLAEIRRRRRRSERRAEAEAGRRAEAEAGRADVIDPPG